VNNTSSVVIGRIPVLECLRARKRPGRKLWLQAGSQGLEAIRNAAGGLPVTEVPRHELDQMARGSLHQGVLLEAAPLPVLDEKTWLAGDIAQDAFVLILDGVEDPQNFGGIIRSAAACGAAAVLYGKDRAAPLSPAALKAAAGAAEHIDLVQAGNTVRLLRLLQEQGFWCAALDAAGEKTLWEADLTGRLALIVGGEGKGVRKLVRDTCDYGIRIPIGGAITSLNASVSAGIALAECLRQRQRPKPA
jgi:23S rRNA (guanosine2251-2'-O)-methyltransferase